MLKESKQASKQGGGREEGGDKQEKKTEDLTLAPQSRVSAGHWRSQQPWSQCGIIRRSAPGAYVWGCCGMFSAFPQLEVLIKVLPLP